MAPASAATSAAQRQAGRSFTRTNDNQPATQALPVPIADDTDMLPITTSVVSNVGAIKSTAGAVPNERRTAAHIPPTATAMKANESQRVPATPTSPSPGRVRML